MDSIFESSPRSPIFTPTSPSARRAPLLLPSGLYPDVPAFAWSPPISDGVFGQCCLTEQFRLTLPEIQRVSCRIEPFSCSSDGTTSACVSSISPCMTTTTFNRQKISDPRLLAVSSEGLPRRSSCVSVVEWDRETGASRPVVVCSRWALFGSVPGLACVCLRDSPSPTKLLVLAGDISGHVALYDVSRGGELVALLEGVPQATIRILWEEKWNPQHVFVSGMAREASRDVLLYAFDLEKEASLAAVSESTRTRRIGSSTVGFGPTRRSGVFGLGMSLEYGLLFSTSDEHCVRLWDLSHGRFADENEDFTIPLATIPTPLTGYSLHVDENRCLVVVGFVNGTVAGWDWRKPTEPVLETLISPSKNWVGQVSQVDEDTYVGVSPGGEMGVFRHDAKKNDVLQGIRQPDGIHGVLVDRDRTDEFERCVFELEERFVVIVHDSLMLFRIRLAGGLFRCWSSFLLNN